jgi:exosortase A-associated hydrolase 1
MNDARERAIAFACRGETLIGIVSPAASAGALGVVIVVGGPQYRAGSHRQFVSLARHLAATGFPTLRFDYRGMGDSTGARQPFDAIHEDIRTAIDALQAAEPSVGAVALWGLCDAASAAMMYAPNDRRVCAIVAANPWARADDTYARTQLKHYYTRRLMSADLWKKILLGRFNPLQSATELKGNLAKATGQRHAIDDYRDRMLAGLRRFDGKVLLITSGQDLTAREFLAFAESQAAAILGRSTVARLALPEADHTFSHRAWKQQVENETARWLTEVARETVAAPA